MATVLAPRVYGLDAICAAALAIGGEEAAHFARRLYARVADKDLAAAPADQRDANQNDQKAKDRKANDQRNNNGGILNNIRPRGNR